MNTKNKTMDRKNPIVFFSCLGAILEYYDFIIYGMMAIYISQVFFANTGNEVSYLKTFSILSIGYLARPLGGYLFGVLSDIYGRKRSLLFVMILMASATLMIGCAPTYAQVGIWAPLLLVLARILQGLSFGAEMPTLTTVIKEYYQNKSSGAYFGFIISSTSVGTVLASFVVYLISRFYSHEEIIDWAWRIPFLFGSILGLFVAIIRSRIDETKAFLECKEQNKTYTSSSLIALDLFKNYKSKMLYSISITLTFSFLIALTLYVPVYLKQYFHFATQDVFSAQTKGILIAVIMSPIFGWFFDRFNRVSVLQILASSFILFLFCALQAFKLELPWALDFLMMGFQVFLSAYATNLLYILSNVFPLPIRATGIGICYNVAHGLASLSPLILESTVNASNHEFVLLGYSTVIVGITLFGSFAYSRRGKSARLQAAV